VSPYILIESLPIDNGPPFIVSVFIKGGENVKEVLGAKIPS